MNSFRQLQSDNEILDILEFLRIRKNEQWNSQNLEYFFHTIRMLQSIKFLVRQKRIFVHNVFKNKVVMVNFSSIKKTPLEHYEIWIDETLSSNEIQLLGHSLLQIFETNINDGKKCFLYSTPIIIKDELINSKYEIYLAHVHPLNNYLYNYDYNISHGFYLKPKPGFEIRRIPTENVGNVIKNWKFATIEDQDWIKYSINNFPSLGIWDVSNNEMIGQFIYVNAGLFGSLHIDDKYRGMGLGKLLVLEMIEVVKSRNMEMIISIELDNNISKCLFEKLNFQKVSSSVYMVFTQENNFHLKKDS